MEGAGCYGSRKLPAPGQVILPHLSSSLIPTTISHCVNPISLMDVLTSEPDLTQNYSSTFS